MLESATVLAASSQSRVAQPGVCGPGVQPRAAAERGLPLRLGVLTEQIPPAMVDEAVAETGRVQRRCRLLPARAVVYFVLGLCLFSGADATGPPGYRSVARSLTGGLRPVGGLRLPTSAALTRARQRLGAAPLQALFARIRGPLGQVGTPGVCAFGRRIVAWDGTGIDTADTAANAEAFGRAGTSHAEVAGHPQLRLLALIECGTHAVLAAAFDGFHAATEQALARRVLGGLAPGMLLLADRNFPGHVLWGAAAGTGADLAWRIKRNHVFVPVRRLADGSFLSVMGTPAENVRHGQARAAGRPLPGPPEGHLVRIVEYTVTVTAADGNRREEPFRLVTTLLDPLQAPAAELAALYHERWESELGYGELKTRLRGAAVILRSRSPELVRQEMFAFLVVYQALCALRVAAAQTAGIDPDRISFTITIRLARDQAGTQAAAIPGNLQQAVEQTITDLLDDQLPPRRSRTYERIKRPPKNTYPRRKHDHVRPPSKVSYALTVTGDSPYLGKHHKSARQ
jgi:hypothetical protein